MSDFATATVSSVEPPSTRMTSETQVGISGSTYARFGASFSAGTTTLMVGSPPKSWDETPTLRIRATDATIARLSISRVRTSVADCSRSLAGSSASTVSTHRFFQRSSPETVGLFGGRAGHKPPHRRRDARSQVNLRPPTEADLGAARIQDRFPDVAHARRTPGRADAPLVSASDRLQQLVDVRLDAGADVVNAACGGAGRGRVGAGDILDVHEVARLKAVAFNRHRRPPVHRLAEDGDDSGLPGGVLSRPVHVGVAQGGIAQAVGAGEGLQVVLERELGRPVVVDGSGLIVFADRDAGRLAVHGGRRGVDEPAARAPRELDQSQAPGHVHVQVDQWRRLGATDADLGGVMADDIRADVIQEALDIGACDVELVKGRC